MKRLLLALLLPLTLFGQQQHDRSTNRGTSTFDTYRNTATVVITGTTPSVATGNVFKTNNGSSTTVTNFLGGTDSQRIVILCGEGNTIIANNANISIAGGSNFSCVINTGIEFVYDASQSKWIENGGTGTGGGGGGGSPGSPAQALQCNSGSGTFVACNATDNGTTLAVTENHSVTGTETIGGATTVGGQFTANADSQLCGPNPMVDVRCYHVRATTTSGTPFAPGITANVTGTAATLSSASSFQNGDGVTFYGAGSACGLSTPGAPTVTPSIAGAGTGTGVVVNAPAGAGAGGYVFAARDKLGCLSAVSATGSTSTANTLGKQVVTVSGYTRATNVVTATATAHGLAVGATTYIQNSSASDNFYFGGEVTVATVPDANHFTWLSTFSVTGGAPTASAGGGTATYWNCNHLSWTTVANATEYYIYGRTAGSLTLIGVSRPQNLVNSVIDTTWDDYGSPMMDGILLPFFVPTTPSGTSLNHPFTTTICAGAGTTSLTLCGSAPTSVTGATVLFDNAPNIATAASHATSQSLLYFPAGSYVVNSYLTIPGNVSVHLAAATLFLNDTMEVGGTDKFYGNLLGQGANSSSFGWAQSGGFITVNRANPGIFGPSGLTLVDGLAITGSANADLLMVVDNFIQNQVRNTNFIDGGGSGDYMGVNFLSRSSFWSTFDTVLFAAGPGQSGGGFLGSTATPAVILVTGSTTFKNISSQDRGIFFNFGTLGSLATETFLGVSRDQGGITPFITAYAPTNSFTSFYIGDVEMDTTPLPRFANLTPAAGGFGGSVVFTGGGSGPASGYSDIQGGPIGNVVGSIGQNFSAISANNFTNNPVSISANGEFMFPISNTAAPTTGISATGSFPVGNFSYAITVIDVNGNESVISPFVNFTTTSGNQTVTVTPPSAPAGAVGWRPYRCASNGAGCSLANIAGCTASFVAFGTTYVDSFAFGCGNSPPSTNKAGAQTLSQVGLSGSAVNVVGGGFKSAQTFPGTANQTIAWPNLSGTPALSNAAQTWSGNQTSVALIQPSIGGETVSAAPRSPLNAILPGALTTTYTGQTFTLDKAVTVTRLQVQLRVPPSGCGTNAIIRLSDGTNNVNLTLTAAANDSGAITQNFAAAAVLTVAVQTAASGCSVAPGDANVAVESRMQ